VNELHILEACLFAGVLVWYSWRKLRKPAVRSVGSILSSVRVVDLDEMKWCSSALLVERVEALPSGVRREARRRQRAIVYSGVADMKRNAKLFHQVGRFEEERIEPGKSSFAFDGHEDMVAEFVKDVERLRERILLLQVAIVLRRLAGTWQTFDLFGRDILCEYKGVEGAFLILCQEAKGRDYYDSMRERLGLDWRMYGGGDGPAAA
jgi:hypothetical protein